jgi:hypothetical protein
MNDSLQCGQREFILKLKSKNGSGFGNKFPVLHAGQVRLKMDESLDLIIL